MLKQFQVPEGVEYNFKNIKSNIVQGKRESLDNKWNASRISPEKRYSHLSFKNKDQRKKISLSGMKKLKESKNSFATNQKIALQKLVPIQNVYPSQQNNFSRIPMISNLIPIPQQPRLAFTRRSPRPLQVVNGKQRNLNFQNSAYYLNSQKQTQIHKSVSKINHAQHKNDTEQRYSFGFNSNKNIQSKDRLFNTCRNPEQKSLNIKSSTKQKQSVFELPVKPNQLTEQKQQHEHHSKTQPKQWFRRIDSLGSDEESYDNADSIVLGHYPGKRYEHEIDTQQDSQQGSFTKILSLSSIFQKQLN